MAKVNKPNKAAKISPELAGILRHLLWNLGRADRLVSMHEKHIGSKKKDPSGESDDLLRAAIVFAHASLEEFLRSCSSHLLPNCSSQVLDEIPLVGLNHLGKPEKFLLGKLVPHKGKLVDEVIKDSVQEFLQKTSYNSASDVARALEQCGLDISFVKKFFPAIDAMIKRRHQIVHRADRDFGNRRRKLVASKITAYQTRLWIYTSANLLLTVFAQFNEKHAKLRFPLPQDLQANT
jgi:hypothetical protein